MCVPFALMFLEQRGVCLLTERDILQECKESVTQHPLHSFTSKLTVHRTTYNHTRATDKSLLRHIYLQLFFLPPSNGIQYIPLQLFRDYVHPSVDGDITLTILATNKPFGMVKRTNKKKRLEGNLYRSHTVVFTIKQIIMVSFL